MKIQLLAIGTHLPEWVNAGFAEYQKRLPRDWQLTLTEIPAQKRLKSIPVETILAQEAQALLKNLPAHHVSIALERTGQVLDTHGLAKQLHNWHQQSQDISILIGGPEGLPTTLLQQMTHSWSLSALTLPHPLVRIVLAEQIYRAWSIINHHPYHR